jgi:hypothetical protein
VPPASKALRGTRILVLRSDFNPGGTPSCEARIRVTGVKGVKPPPSLAMSFSKPVGIKPQKKGGSDFIDTPCRLA